MDAERFVKPRSFKPMGNEPLPPKPAPSPIVDRFKAMLREREEDLTASLLTHDDVPPPSTAEIVRFYEMVLSELTFNSKPIITDLTIIAGEQREHAEGIADAICARIVQAPFDQKLPSMYLLDSIVKNIGKEYHKYFSARLPEVFCEAYRQVSPDLHSSMRHLFGTWSTVFPSSLLQGIEARLPSLSNEASSLARLRASESSRPAHGIHVNPKYLKGMQHAKGASSIFGMYRQKPGLGYDEYDSNDAESIPPMVGEQRLISTGKLPPSSTARIARSASPSGVGGSSSILPTSDEFTHDNSPRRVSGRVSPSNREFVYGYGRATGGDMLMNDWRKNNLSEDTVPRFKTSWEYTKALIDAYGNDQGSTIVKNKPQEVEGLDINGVDPKEATKTWQNAEEEEFDWEDMSPTLAGRRQIKNSFSSSSPPDGSFTKRPAFHSHIPAPAESDFQGRNWSNQAPHSVVNGSPLDDGVPFSSSSHGSIYRLPGFNDGRTQTQDSRFPEEKWNLPITRPQFSEHQFNGRDGRNFQLPSLTSICSLPGDEQRPFQVDSFPNVDEHLRGITTSSLRMGSSNLDSLVTYVPSAFPPTSSGVWPPVNTHKSQQLALPPPLRPPLNQIRSHFDSTNADNTFAESSSLQQQFLLPHDVRKNLVPPSHGYPRQGHGASIGAAFPPLPHGPPPTSSQLLPVPQNLGPPALNPPGGGALSGLISSLVAQGLISMAKPSPKQDAVGLDFNPDILKARHESAITALYGDLPRQCKSCGLRFKQQEEHSAHMDWHVTKNRISKNRKQKPSRKWFVSVNMWLSGAEALGTDSVPGFLPAENIVETKEDEELSVPADEDQNACALCGETFDDFYSDETEEWMYKGAVYMNAPYGATVGMDRSRLGPIVHANLDPALMVIPIDDHMVHRGHGVFDTAIILDGYLYELDVHIDRFLNSASKAKIKPPFPRSAIRSILIQLTSESNCKKGTLRYWLSAGPGDFLLSPSNCPESAFYAVVINEDFSQCKDGVTVITSTVPMKSPLFATMKNVNYLPNVLSKMEAEERGASASIWVDEDGYIAEGPNVNVGFVSQNGELILPRFDKILAGCTAKRLIELAPKLVEKGVLKGVKMADVTVEEAKGAAEMMYIGSTLPILPIVAWDDKPIGNGKVGELTMALLDLVWEDMVAGPESQRLAVPYK